MWTRAQVAKMVSQNPLPDQGGLILLPNLPTAAVLTTAQRAGVVQPPISIAGAVATTDQKVLDVPENFLLEFAVVKTMEAVAGGATCTLSLGVASGGNTVMVATAAAALDAIIGYTTAQRGSLIDTN